MMELTVGIRDFKANLSAYLKKVEKGQRIIVTSNGKAVADIHPHREELMERVKALQVSGIVAWSGKKPQRRKPAVVNTSDKLISDLVVEQRE